MNHLRIFIAVADKMNMTEASQALFISQPAVSKAVKSLEESLSVKLFVRDKPHGLALTEAGKDILRLARQMKAIENQIYQVAGGENRLLRGKVTIGSFPAASANLLPETIAVFRNRYPNVRIELTEGTSDQIKAWVDAHSVDVGIVASPFGEYEAEVLIQDGMVAALPPGHSLENADRIGLERNRSELIFCKGGHEAAIEGTFRDHRIDYEENLTVQTAETLVHMVKRGLGIGVVSRFTLASVAAHGLKVKEIDPPVAREIAVIARSFADAAPATREFVRVLTDWCRQNWRMEATML
ncbi:LysR family transcriptional regulator [Cohnella sp. CBP 2801]|uniref:LysR family transcriptional regulator n=2 Tax=Cohnella zeiphila TaxID=2761120 RepID=A0A7X0SQG7_9BACL|nr:LysR family transcriptional regulator [Cohnella zeiphila]